MFKLDKLHSALLLPATLLVSFLVGSPAVAGQMTSQLTGDIRDNNPNGLIVDVTIDYSGNVAEWTIDINSPLHADIKLQEFYFNLNVDPNDVTFSGFDPIGWTINSPASVSGAGGATFMFESLDPNGQPNADDVTNTTNLLFSATLASSDWQDSSFLSADDAVSNDAGSGQLGAKLQSLTLGNDGDPATSDSGFAFGDYKGSGGPTTGPDPNIAPEPSSMAIFALGLLAAGSVRRRRTKS